MLNGWNGDVTAFGATLILALLFAPWVRGAQGPRRGVLLLATCLLLAVPLLLPETRPLGRCLWAVVALAASGKLLEHSRSPRRGYGDFARFLVDPFSMTYAMRTQRLPMGAWDGLDLLRVSAGATATTLGVMAFSWVGRQGFGFWAEHLLKAPIAWMCIDASAQSVYSLVRLFGFQVPLLSDLAMLSRSPAEWWRRYNRVVGTFLGRHVYRPLAGEGRYGRAVMGTFLVSALMHEYILSIVFGRFDGYPFAFFMVQGAGVWVSGVLARRFPRPGTAARIAGRTAHLAFMLSTVVLFTASVDRVALPWFYQAEVWLPW